MINLVAGKEAYSDSNSLHRTIGEPFSALDEAACRSTWTRLLRGEVSEAKSDLEKVIVKEAG